MADLETENRIVQVLLGIIEMLSMSVAMMEQMIAKPTFLDAGTRSKRFRFEKPDALIFQVLMCVRIVSGLRAAAILLMNAHVTEVGVLFRTIDDLIAEINFVDELIEKGPENVTASQREFLDLYFVDDNRTTEDLLENRRKINYNERRQKVQASEARVFGGEDPDRIKKIVRAVDDVWSGVVHGSYSSVMTMYGGDGPDDAHFHTRGMPVRFSEYRHHLGLYVHRALNTFFKVSHNFGHTKLAEQLRNLRREFEASAAYSAE